jgi:hypothetical protein
MLSRVSMASPWEVLAKGLTHCQMRSMLRLTTLAADCDAPGHMLGLRSRRLGCRC